MATHIVTRAFPGPAGQFRAGERVNADSWKNRKTLEHLNYIRPLLASDVAASAGAEARGQQDAPAAAPARPIADRGRKGA